MEALGTLDGHPLEVSVLDEARPFCGMRVLGSGRPCFVGERDAYTDCLEHMAQSYRENAPRHRAAEAEVRAEPAAGHAG